MVIEVLEKNLHDARNGRKVNTMINLREPVDKNVDYDRAIQMLLMDDWSWKQQFTMSNSMYLDKMNR